MSETTGNSASAQETSRRRDWTKGPILRNLLILSWPMIVMEATYMVSQLFDLVWVGRSGSAALAGLGIGLMICFMVSTVDMAIIAGMRAMIARFVGAGDPVNARKVAAQAYILAFGWGAIVSVGGYFLAEPLVRMFGVEPAVVTEGTRYLRVMFLGWISMGMLVMGLYIMQSSGDSFNPMILEVIIRVVHVAISPFLVLGLWIFPAMGITGAALANVISQILGALFGFWYLFGGHTRLKLRLSDIRFIPGMTWRLLRIGIPSLISMVQMTASNFLLTWIVAPFGTAALAAHSLVNNINGFVSTPNIGMSAGMSVLAGQNLGAKQPQRAVKSTLLGAAVLQGFLVVCIIVILIWAENIVGLFTQDPETVKIATTFLRIATAAYLVMGLSAAFMACINGAGDTLATMIINIGMIWLVQIPLAFILANHTGLEANGIRWALVTAVFTTAAVSFLYFKFGKWRTKRV
ncbi:MAG TPA: MATE family efflux transporter [Dehalococcoidales bacterium]|nr:MATE family efflux transporter [Dehalococcoidales bacterium]